MGAWALGQWRRLSEEHWALGSHFGCVINNIQQIVQTLSIRIHVMGCLSSGYTMVINKLRSYVHIHVLNILSNVSLPHRWNLASPTARLQCTGFLQATNKLSHTTLQPIKMPQISSQNLDKPRNEGAIKLDVVFSSLYQQARAAMFNLERSERSPGCMFMPLQFLA